MKLTNKALDALRNNAQAQAAIAVALDVRLSTVARYIRENNDDLTKAAAIAEIKKHTGLTQDQILKKVAA